MSGRTAKVILAKTDARDNGETQVEITVLISSGNVIMRSPQFADVPAEVRKALMDWMGHEYRPPVSAPPPAPSSLRHSHPGGQGSRVGDTDYG